MSNRKNILNDAMNVICNDRQNQYGNAENSFFEIAKLWTGYLNTTVTSFDVAMMMILLKIARCKSNPYHNDNYIDICGYAALAGEMFSYDELKENE